MEFKFAKNVKILGLIFVLLSVFFVFYASCSQRGLYMDGSFYFMQLLDSISKQEIHFAYTPFRARLFVQCFQEIPVLLAGLIFVIKSKITLATIYSLTLFLVPLLIMWWNFELTKRTKEYGIFFWSVFTYCVLILLYQIFALVETIIGIPLQFVLLNYLFGKINYTKWDKIGIAFILLMMFGIYEHTILVGLFIFAGTFIAAFDETNDNNVLVKICIGGISLAAACYNLFFLIWHFSDMSSSLLSEFTDFWVLVPKLNIVLSVFTVILLCCLLFRKKSLGILSLSAVSAGYLYIFYNMLNDLQTYLNPVEEGHMRSIVCWAVPLIFLGIVVYKYKTKNKEVENKDVLINNALVPVLLCGIFLTAWQVVHTYYWNQNIDYLKNEIQNCEDLLYVPAEHEEISSFENEKLRRYIWHGNYATTQIVFDKNYEIPTLLIHYDEEKETGNNCYRSGMYYLPEKELINLPYDYRFSVQNYYWNLRNVAEALNVYNSQHNIHIENYDNENDNNEDNNNENNNEENNGD